MVPITSHSIPLLESDELIRVRPLYGLVVTAGKWLPWAVLGLLTAGVLATRRRSAALMVTSGTLSLVMLGLVAALAMGGRSFASALSRDEGPMTRSVAHLLYNTITQTAVLNALWVSGVAAAIALGTWIILLRRPSRDSPL